MGILDLFRGRPTVVEGTHKLAEGHARKIDVGDPLAGTGTQVVLCRVEGVLYALDAKCPHEGGRISDGPLVEGKLAMCPLHRYTFDPRTGKAAGRVCADAKTYRAREKNGNAQIWL